MYVQKHSQYETCLLLEHISRGESAKRLHFIRLRERQTTLFQDAVVVKKSSNEDHHRVSLHNPKRCVLREKKWSRTIVRHDTHISASPRWITSFRNTRNFQSPSTHFIRFLFGDLFFDFYFYNRSLVSRLFE